MLNKLTAMVETKKIISLLVTIVFCLMSLRGDITTEQFMTVFTIIITFYFVQSSLKNNTV